MFHVKQLLIITGATSGIGLSCIEDFLIDGDLHILAIGRNTDKINLNDSRLFKLNCDVTKFELLRSKLQPYLFDYNVVGLINAAGVASVGGFEIEDHDNHQQMIDANIQGLTNCIEIVLPKMREQQNGTIINLSSLADRYPRPNNAVYAATKAYVKSLSDSLRLQNSKYNIRVVNLAPALIETPMLTDQLGIKDGLIEVKQFSKIVKFIFDQPQNICIRDIVVAPTLYAG